jgi:DNA-binding response OmpR family regulator
MCCLIRSHEPSELALGRVPSSPPLLIVDDDAISRRVLRQCLDKAGFASHTVGSGSEAISWLAENQPSLVMLDLMMPDTDGYDVLAAMRADERLREVPVVVLTALDRDSDVARAFDLGADDFIRKPFRPVELLARIQSQLRMREYVLSTAHRERDAQVVLEITQALASSLDIRTILYTVVRRIAEVARVDRCSIVLTRDKGDVGYVVAASDDQDLHDLPIDVEKYPEIGKVLETGEPLVISDVKEHPLLEVVRSGLPSHAFRSLRDLHADHVRRSPPGRALSARPSPHRHGRSRAVPRAHGGERDGHRPAQRAHGPDAALGDPALHVRALRSRAPHEGARALRGLLQRVGGRHRGARR